MYKYLLVASHCDNSVYFFCPYIIEVIDFARRVTSSALNKPVLKKCLHFKPKLRTFGVSYIPTQQIITLMTGFYEYTLQRFNN